MFMLRGDRARGLTKAVLVVNTACRPEVRDAEAECGTDQLAMHACLSQPGSELLMAVLKGICRPRFHNHEAKQNAAFSGADEWFGTDWR